MKIMPKNLEPNIHEQGLFKKEKALKIFIIIILGLKKAKMQ